MKLNELQKYILKIYAIVILFFTFFVPHLNESGATSFNFVFIHNGVEHVDWAYLILLYVGITIATIAAILSFNDLKRKLK